MYYNAGVNEPALPVFLAARNCERVEEGGGSIDWQFEKCWNACHKQVAIQRKKFLEGEGFLTRKQL